MSGLSPLPPRGVERRLEKRSRKLLDQIEQGDDPDAVEEYKDFLTEHGKYFYSLEQVLPAHQIQTYALDSIVSKDGKKGNDYANAFLRPKAPTYLARGGKAGVQEFVVTKESMESKELLASLSSNGHSSSAKKKIWYADIFARPLHQSKDSEIAHLIPDAPAHAKEWYDVACWAIGTDPEQTDWGSVFRLIHGTRGTDKKRQFGCGMRHFVANKACITGQERLIDKEDPQ